MVKNLELKFLRDKKSGVINYGEKFINKKILYYY